MTVLFATLTAGLGYYSFQGKIGKGYGLALSIIHLTLTLFGIGNVTEKQSERKAEQARVGHQQQQQKERLAALRANNDANFMQGKNLVAEGKIAEAMKSFTMVRQVDPRYDGLNAQINIAQDRLMKQLLADPTEASRSDVYKPAPRSHARPPASPTGTLEQQFDAGIATNMACPQLFALRNQLKMGKPTAYQEKMNEQLRSVGCTYANAHRSAATPTPQPPTRIETANNQVAGCDELKARALAFVSDMDSTSARMKSAASSQQRRTILADMQGRFSEHNDVPKANAAMARAADLLHASSGCYSTAGWIASRDGATDEQILGQIRICGDDVVKMDAAFVSAGCPLN